MIEIDSSIINPTALLDRVKASVRMKNIPGDFFSEGSAEGVASGACFAEKIRGEMQLVYYNLQTMNETWEIRELPIVSDRPVIGKLIVFGKKVFRKLTRWLFRSYYDQQIWFNGAVTRTVSDLIRVQEMLLNDVEQGISEDMAQIVVTNQSRIQQEMVQVHHNLQTMNAAWIIRETEIISNRPVVGKLIVFCKKVFRKLTRWMFRGYYDQQTNFNGAATRTISDMIRVQELLIGAYTQEGRKE